MRDNYFDYHTLKEDLIEIKSNIYFSLYDAKILVEKRKNWLENAIKKVSKNALLEDEFLYLGEVKKLQDYNIKNLDKFYKNEIEKILPNIVETFSKKVRSWLISAIVKFALNKKRSNHSIASRSK